VIHQQVVITIPQSIRYIRFHNTVTRKQWWIFVERGLGCSNLAPHSLALANDYSAKRNRFLHHATSHDLGRSVVCTCMVHLQHVGPLTYLASLAWWAEVSGVYVLGKAELANEFDSGILELGTDDR